MIREYVFLNENSYFRSAKYQKVEKTTRNLSRVLTFIFAKSQNLFNVFVLLLLQIGLASHPIHHLPPPKKPVL